MPIHVASAETELSSAVTVGIVHVPETAVYVPPVDTYPAQFVVAVSTACELAVVVFVSFDGAVDTGVEPEEGVCVELGVVVVVSGERFVFFEYATYWSFELCASLVLLLFDNFDTSSASVEPRPIITTRQIEISIFNISIFLIYIVILHGIA
jgi:hypothetical protein